MAREISKTLSELLGPRYDKQIRPGFGKKPVEVEVNLSVLGIGPVDELKQVNCVVSIKLMLLCFSA